MAERTPTIHEKEIKINKNKLKDLIDSRGLEYIQFHTRLVDSYGLDLTYKGFMSLLSNKSSWKLLYAHAIAETLKVDYMDIFEVVEVDVEEVKRKRAEWKEKYQK